MTEPLDLDALEAQCNLGNVLYPEEGLELIAELRACHTDLAQARYDKREVEALFEADHDGWRRRADEAEATIARVRAWAVNGTYDAQQAASFRRALEGDDD